MFLGKFGPPRIRDLRSYKVDLGRLQPLWKTTAGSFDYPFLAATKQLVYVGLSVCMYAVSYTHLTLPTKRIV